MRLWTAALGLCPVSLRDLDLARRHRPDDFLDRNRKGYREALRNVVAILFSWGQDDVFFRPPGHGRNGPTHDLAVAFDVHLADREPHGEIVNVVPFPADDERASREELPRLGLFRDLFRQDPVRAPADEARGPRLAVRERELACFPQRALRGLRAVLDHG